MRGRPGHHHVGWWTLQAGPAHGQRDSNQVRRVRTEFLISVFSENCLEFERSRRGQSVPGENRTSWRSSLGLTSGLPEPLLTPGLLSRGGLEGSRETPSPRVQGKGGSEEEKIEDTIRSMWSWYYGSKEQANNKRAAAGQKRVKPRSNSISFDLTEALDPEWYFR